MQMTQRYRSLTQAEASVMVKESILKPDVSIHSHSMVDPLDKPPDPPPDLKKVQHVRKKK